MHEFPELVRQVWHASFRGTDRRYHRFRTTADDTFVADCIGSNLRCAHEWGWCEGILDDPSAGRFYSPNDIVTKAKEARRTEGCTRIRLTGMEPAMHDSHLLQLADMLPDDFSLVIETNGMLVSRGFLDQLCSVTDLHLRLSFKGTTPDQFQTLSRVAPSYFHNQIEAYQAALNANCQLETALAGVFDTKDKERLEDRLSRYKEDVSVELEPLRLCPANEQRLKKAGFDLEQYRDDA